MIVDRQRLCNVLEILRTACGNKTLDVADNIKFAVDKKEHRLTLSSTNFIAFISVDFGDLSLVDMSDVPDMFLLPADLLYDIIKASTTNSAEFIGSNSDSVITVITNGKYTLNRHSQESSFPTADYAMSEIGKWKISDLLPMWEKGSIAISKDVTKLSYQGVYFDGCFVSTDANRLAVMAGVSDKSFSALIPPSFGDILKMCKGNEIIIGLNPTVKTLVLYDQSIGLASAYRLLDADYVDYKRLINSRSYQVKFKINRSEILWALKRLNSFTDNVYKVINIEINTNQNINEMILTVERGNSGVEKIKLNNFEVNQDSKSENLTTRKYHIQNLGSGIEAIESDEVSMSLQKDGKIWIDEGKFTYLLTTIIS